MMKWALKTVLAACGLLVISCSGPRTTAPPRSILPPVVMSTAAEVDTSACRKRCARATDACMTSCTSGQEEEACAGAAVKCMNRCKPGAMF